MSARILLVEDDPVSQDLLRNVLQARGYAVDAVGDGFAGLRLMAQKGYDLALVDYHLPELDGYASARLMRDAAHGGVVPKLVAITADRHGLTARSGAETLFDAILTKPIEPQPLFRFIETILDASGEHASAQAAARAFLRDPRHERARAAAEAFWRDRGLTGRPKALAVPQPTPEQALALSFCFQMGETDAADLIVLLDRAGIADLPALHERLPGRPTPVVDVTGQALEACDAAFRINDPSSWSEVAGLLNRFAARGAQLIPAARGGAESDARLLACLYVADRSLRLVHDPSQRVPVRPGGWFTEPDAMLAAERLTARGLLTRQIRERPPGGLEFIYALTERAIAELTASDPRAERREGTESVRETLERAVREASRAFGSGRNAAGEAGGVAQIEVDPAVPREAAAPVVALDRLPQTKRDVAAGADAPDKPLDPPGPKAVASSGPETRLAPAQAASEGARSGSSGPAPKSHGVQAFLDLIKPSAGQPASPAGQPAKTAELRPSAGRILLVEAVDVNLEVARAMLEAGGCAVEVATGGAEAVAATQKHAYGLVLMAVQMPGVDGLAAARRIRALPPPAGDVPIVGMSASPLPDQAAALREAGMNDHLGKPFRRADLEAVIARWRRPEPPAPEPDAFAEAFDRAVYDGLTELVGRERVVTLLDRLAAQLNERFAGEPASDADRARLARDAHAMISAAGALGFSALSAACQSLESAVSAGGGVAAPLERVKTSRARALRAIAVLKQAA